MKVQMDLTSFILLIVVLAIMPILINLFVWRDYLWKKCEKVSEKEENAIGVKAGVGLCGINNAALGMYGSSNYRVPIGFGEHKETK